MKFIVVSGGVMSGLGKGVTAASIGLLLKSKGIKVSPIKSDMYLNIDAGTMNPIEHGETFVTHDGLETDQDLGHYERFMDITLYRENYVTNGQVYTEVLKKERALEYQGKCVEPYNYIPPEIIKHWESAGKRHGAEVVLVELGGTVGEYEGMLFFEAVRRLKLKSPKDVVLVHVGYLPVPPSIGELKSKPLQQSVQTLNSLGLQPDFIIARANSEVDEKRKEKISLASGVPIENIISNPDVESIYEVPIGLEKQKLSQKIIKLLRLKPKQKDLVEWRAFLKAKEGIKREVKIGIISKYHKTGDYTLEDSYVCVVEAIKHASWKVGVKPKIVWVSAEKLETGTEAEFKKELEELSGIIVPQGWGSRGTEGKVKAIKFARENNVPYLGLCFGMQMAVIEFARNVLGFTDANSTEVDPKSKHQVIHIIEGQAEYLAKKQYGGTIRLGAWPCVIKKGTKLSRAYEKLTTRDSAWKKEGNVKVAGKSSNVVYERHRHRYEFNLAFLKKFEANGLVVSGLSPDGKLVEAIELPSHKFFVGVQFHPEYLSRPLNPHPIFVSFLEAMLG